MPPFSGRRRSRALGPCEPHLCLAFCLGVLVHRPFSLAAAARDARVLPVPDDRPTSSPSKQPWHHHMRPLAFMHKSTHVPTQILVSQRPDRCTSPVCVSATPTHASEHPSSQAPPPKPRKSTWERVSKVFNKVQDIAQSDDFQRLARGTRTLLKEIDIEVPTMEQNLGALRRTLDRSLGSTLLSFEKLLQHYESRSPEADVLLSVARKRVTKLVRHGLHQLMTPTAVEWAIYAVNSTALLVEEEAARVLAAQEGSAENSLDVPSFQDMQREVMRRMVVVAEDVEALAQNVIQNRWFRTGYSDEELKQLEALLHARVVPRLLLAVAAAVLHGWRPLQDPLLTLLVVGFASGSLSKSVAGNLMELFEASLVVKDGWEGSGKEGERIVESFPDVWRTRETAAEIGEALFRLFESVERRSAIRVEARQARARAAASAATGSIVTGTGTAALPDESSPPTHVAIPPTPASTSPSSLPPAPTSLPSSSHAPSTPLSGEKKFMVASYALPNKLTSLSGGAGPQAERERGRDSVYYPAFESTRRGKRLRYLVTTVHLTRTYWKTAATAMLGTMGLVFLARLYGSPVELTIGGDERVEGREDRREGRGRRRRDERRDGLLFSTPLEVLEEE